MAGRGLFITALLLGLMAAGIVLSLFGNGFGATKPGVVVAATDIQPGVAIRAEQLKIIEWGAAELPQGAFQRVDQIIGRVLRVPAFPGEQLLESKLAPKTAKGGLATIITPGSRAISVSVDEVVGVAGFALPGAYVDVLVSAKDANQAPFSRIVLERIKVLAAEQETTADPNVPKVVRAVTLELTPREAEILDLARSVGTLSLALRSEFDNARGQGRGARQADLGVGALPVPPGPAQSAPTPVAGKTSQSSATASTLPLSAPRVASPVGGQDQCCGGQPGIEEIRGSR